MLHLETNPIRAPVARRFCDTVSGTIQNEDFWAFGGVVSCGVHLHSLEWNPPRSRAFAAAFERRKSFGLHSLERDFFDSEKSVYRAAHSSKLSCSAKISNIHPHLCHNPKKPHIMQYKVNYQERKNNREKNFRNYRNVPALGRNRHTYRVLSSDCRACLYRGAAAHNCRISLP